MATLGSLNYDCLREILQHCDTNDHIAFVIAFEQFKPIVQDIWKMFWTRLCLENDSNATKIFYPYTRVWGEINYESLKAVVDLIQPFVEKIEIFGQNKEMWDIINESKFANATELRLNNTSAAPIVKSCFPNLRSLVLDLDSVVKYNPEWNGLEHVNLRLSYKGINEKMEFISQLKLKKLRIWRSQQPIPDQYLNYEYFSELEEIGGTISTMKEFANTLKVMPKLRKVSVEYDYAEISSDISIFSKILGTRAVEFFYRCVNRPTDDFECLENQLQVLPNLKRLTVEFYDIETIQMFSSSCHLHLLKAIILADMSVDAEVLTNILISVPQLELLDVCSATIESTIHLDVARIAQKRSNPITINLDPLYFEVQLNAATDLIKITKNLTSPEHYYEFEYVLEREKF